VRIDLRRISEGGYESEANAVNSARWWGRLEYDSVRAAALDDLLDWIYTDGQQSAVQEGYSELPPPLLAAVRKKVKELQ